MDTTTLPWRLDVGSGQHGWLLVRAGDETARAEAHRAAKDARFTITGDHTYVLDPRVGPALAYPLTPLTSVAEARKPHNS